MTLLAAALFLAQTPAVCPVAWTGTTSLISEAQTLLIGTESDWRNMWLEHTGQPTDIWPPKDPVPEVDFSTYCILAIFGGKIQQTAGYTAHSFEKSDDTAIFRFVPRVYGVSSGPNTPKDAFQNTPYGFFLIPKGLKRVRLEEGIIESKSEPVKKFKAVGEVAIKGLG